MSQLKLLLKKTFQNVYLLFLFIIRLMYGKTFEAGMRHVFKIWVKCSG